MIRHLLAIALFAAPTLAADIPGVTMTGPDGETYPDVTRAGFPGGIPKVEGPVFDVTRHGANGADSADDQPAIQKAVDEAIQAGGAVVYFPDGTYHLNDAVAITGDNVILRGQSRAGTIVQLDNCKTGGGFYDARAALHFEPRQRKIDGRDVKPTAMYKAGDTKLDLGDHRYAVGDVIQWEGKTLIGLFKVVSVDGPAVTLDAPIRVDLSADTGRFRKYGTVKNVGAESLTIVTPKEMNTNGVNFYGVFGGFMRDITVKKPGRFPVGYNQSRHIEIRDCTFDDAWKQGSGGVGYAGFWSVSDGLMTDVAMTTLRHAPNLQDRANGCVIRNSTFAGADMQWHTGVPLFNVVENITVTLGGKDTNSHTLRSSRPGIDQIHEPAGPRNVVYNCDFKAEGNTSGADFGHEMHGWVFAYNRIVVAGSKDPLLRIWYDCADDFVLRGNVLATQNQRKGGGVAFMLKDPSGKTSGNNVRFIDNRFFGFALADGHWYTGPAAPDIDQNNTHSPGFTLPSRPEVPRDASGRPVASLYEWQKRQRK